MTCPGPHGDQEMLPVYFLPRHEFVLKYSNVAPTRGWYILTCGSADFSCKQNIKSYNVHILPFKKYCFQVMIPSKGFYANTIIQSEISYKGQDVNGHSVDHS